MLKAFNIPIACLLLTLASILPGCGKNEAVIPGPAEVAEKMVLVYLSAHNDLQADAINSIHNLEKGFKAGNGNTLLVYVKTSFDKSYLLRISADQAGQTVTDTLKTYEDENSADAAFMQRVIADARALCPARSYGLVLWSHATSWAPPVNRPVTPESFGYDNEKEIDIIDLEKILPDDLEYILFDACSMASMEVCYQLRHKARYILASPSEVLSTGFPYDQITNHLFEGLPGLQQTAQQFLSYYKAQEGLYASATVSLIDTRALEAVTQQTKLLLQAGAPLTPYNKTGVQSLDFENGSGVPAYDFLSFLQHNFAKEAYTELQHMIESAVIYKGTTDSFLGFPVKDFCGLSIYIPEQGDQYMSYYNTLSWSKNSGWDQLFF
jgi:hypothetical protein